MPICAQSQQDQDLGGHFMKIRRLVVTTEHLPCKRPLNKHR
jgi:hypothetical protein